jgi:hypothetical protein
VNWRSGILMGACVAGGLALNLMVLDSAPAGPTAVASQAESIDPAVSPEVIPTELPVTTAATPVDSAPEQTTVPTLPAAVAGGSTLLATSPSSPRPAFVATPTQPAPAPVQPAPAPPPAAAPTFVAPVPEPPTPASGAAATTPTTHPAAPVPTAQPVPVPVPQVTTAPTTSPATTTSTTSPPTTAPRAPTITYPSYSVAGVAEIYLKLVDGKEISVYSVVRESNWVHQVDGNGPTSVEVKFFNVVTEREAEFHAKIEGGSIKVEHSR